MPKKSAQKQDAEQALPIPANDNIQEKPRQAGLPIKLVRFSNDFTGPVGIKAGPQLKACSSLEPTHRHVLTLYAERNVIKVTWFPQRQPSRSFLIPLSQVSYMVPFESDDKPDTPKG